MEEEVELRAGLADMQRAISRLAAPASEASGIAEVEAEKTVKLLSFGSDVEMLTRVVETKTNEVHEEEDGRPCEVAVVFEDDRVCGRTLPHDVADDNEKPSLADSAHQGLDCPEELACLKDASVSKETATSGIKPRCYRVLLAYCRLVHRCPKAVMFLNLVGVVALLAIFQKPLNLETDFQAFVQADGHAMRNREAYLKALSEQKDLGSRRLQEAWSGFGDLPPFDWFDGQEVPLDISDDEAVDVLEVAGSLTAGRRLEAALFFKRVLSFVYVARDGDALNRKVLSDIGTFEARLRDLSQFREFCVDDAINMNSMRLCDPGETLMAFVLPTWDNGTQGGYRTKMHFDGRGREVLEAHALLELIQRLYAGGTGHMEADPVRFFPRSFDLNVAVAAIGQDEAYTPPSSIRSTFTFAIKLGETGDPMSKVRAVMNKKKQDYEAMVIDIIYPFIRSSLLEYQHIHIYYSGDVISQFEITDTLNSDLRYAAGSFVFVTFYMWVHTQSIVLSIASFLIIVTSVPVAFVLAPAEKTTIASFMSIFLIVGIGCDVVFVFVDFWNQSAQSKQMKMDTEARLAFTILHAGKGCLATSLTTAVSFFANFASVLKPLREFGLFMGLCVMVAFILVLLFLPPLFAVREVRRERVRLRIVDISAGDNLVVKQLRTKHWIARSFRAIFVSNHSRPSKTLFTFACWISRCPVIIVVCTLILILCFVIGVCTDARIDTGFPEIFPADHNQVAGRTAASQFSTVTPLPATPTTPPPRTGDVCDPRDSSDEPCIFYWCNAAIAQPRPKNSTAGTCWRGPTKQTDPVTGIWSEGSWDTSECSTITVGTRLSAEGAPSRADWLTMWGDAVADLTELGECAGPCVWEVRRASGILVFQVMDDDEANATKIKPPGAYLLGDRKGEWLELTDEPGYVRIAGGELVDGDVVKVSGSLAFGADTIQQSGTLVMESWETGELAPDKFYKAPSVTLYPARPGSKLGNASGLVQCKVETLCFFENQRCGLVDWRYLGQYMLSSSARPGRMLSMNFVSATVAQRQQIDVTIIFGMVARPSSQLVGPVEEYWRFDNKFEPTNPWAQRAMMAMCNVPDKMRVVMGYCWIQQFQQYLVEVGKQFPSRDFHSDVIDWYTSDPNSGQAHLWFVNQKMLACKVQFWTDHSKEMGAQKALKYKKWWDEFVDGNNKDEDEDKVQDEEEEENGEAASVTGNRAWHTADAWVRAEAEVAIIKSTMDTIILSAACGGFGMLLFTGDPWLSAIVLFLVLGIISGLAFFMVSIMGWAIGPIEVVSLVVFVGYSVTFALHIAHDFAVVQEDDPMLLETEHWIEQKAAKKRSRSGVSEQEVVEDPKLLHGGCPKDAAPPSMAPLAMSGKLVGRRLREARARTAILHMGRAMISSAASTMGSSAFLLLCTLSIFGKLGAVVIAVSFLSICFALISLPATLIVIGPAPGPFHKRAHAKFRRWSSCLRGGDISKPEDCDGEQRAEGAGSESSGRARLQGLVAGFKRPQRRDRTTHEGQDLLE
mmetsp:Transcript_19256/g.67003  ORF Transcript_19256/g.67003 Transcript_19256/m.67003 type:complete len:1514 (-) Transcript_19256:458-4999(-)